MSKTWPFKDPNEVLDYAFDWSPRNLGEVTIDAVAATVEEGDIIVDSSDVSALEPFKTVHRLSGGTMVDADTPRDCVIGLRITASNGEIYDQSMKIKIKTR